MYFVSMFIIQILFSKYCLLVFVIVRRPLWFDAQVVILLTLVTP